jgi:hypothetical protein
MATQCKGSTYSFAKDGEHFFIFISESSGNRCYYCNAKEAK